MGPVIQAALSMLPVTSSLTLRMVAYSLLKLVTGFEIELNNGFVDYIRFC